MLTRRGFISSAIAGAVLASIPAALPATTSDRDGSFAELLARAKENPDLLRATSAEREGLAREYDYFSTKAIAPRVAPSGRAISKNAIDLIIVFEVTDQKTYMSRYQSATWPKGQSGVTIGIGYDLGYVTKAWLEEDWNGYATAATIEYFKEACGLQGSRAKARLAEFSKVIVSWQTAYDQFTKSLVPRYVGETLKTLPRASELSDDSLGALVSLIYNRGASFNADGDRYTEMRKIRAYMASGDFDLIPDQIISMKRLWVGKHGMAGLLVRRDLEAALFRDGLKVS